MNKSRKWLIEGPNVKAEGEPSGWYLMASADDWTRDPREGVQFATKQSAISFLGWCASLESGPLAKSCVTNYSDAMRRAFPQGV